jgi:arylsulfatase A
MKKIYTRVYIIIWTLALSVLSQAKDKLNIVLIMADDLGYETIAANGCEEYKTPHLDALAAAGIRFNNCYANPICTPSRVKIMTGMSNVRNYVKFGMLDRGQRTFAHELKEAGYATCIGGKWQLGNEKDSPQHFGFDESCLWQHTRPRTKQGSKSDSRYENPCLEINGEEKDYSNGEFAPDVIADYLCDFITRKKDEPFLVYYPMLLTHCPFIPTPESPDYDPKSPGSTSYKGNANYFKGMVEHMDAIVGRIAAHIEKLGLREKTIIIFTGDNGTDKPVVTKWNGKQIAGAKGSLTEAGARVPLIINAPSLIKTPSISEELVDHSDFYPTLCDLAGVTPTSLDDLDGVSLMNALTGQGDRRKREIYIYYSPTGDKQKQKVLARNATHLLVRNNLNSDFEFFQANGPYDLKLLDQNALSERDQTSFKNLAGKIERMSKKYHSHLDK